MTTDTPRTLPFPPFSPETTDTTDKAQVETTDTPRTSTDATSTDTFGGVKYPRMSVVDVGACRRPVRRPDSQPPRALPPGVAPTPELVRRWLEWLRPGAPQLSEQRREGAQRRLHNYAAGGRVSMQSMHKTRARLSAASALTAAYKLPIPGKVVEGGTGGAFAFPPDALLTRSSGVTHTRETRKQGRAWENSAEGRIIPGRSVMPSRDGRPPVTNCILPGQSVMHNPPPAGA